MILVFDLIEDNDVYGCRRRRGSDVSQGQASNTKVVMSHIKLYF
jgi:hypothetical protein